MTHLRRRGPQGARVRVEEITRSDGRPLRVYPDLWPGALAPLEQRRGPRRAPRLPVSPRAVRWR